jgi:threonine dehydratase
MLRIPRLVQLLPIGMKFVKVKEVISSHATVGRSYRNTPLNSSDDLSPRQKVQTWIYNSNSNASFSYKQTNLFQLVQADAH